MTTRHKRIIGQDRAQRVAVGTWNRAQAAARTSAPGAKPRSAPTNQQLAEVARQRAAREPAGSRGRKAAGCLAIALSTTGTTSSARRVLDMVAQDDVRNAARNLLDQLTTETEAIH